MKTAIYATLFHCMSSDQKPQHKKCPSIIDSWCFYESSLARGKKPGFHKDWELWFQQDCATCHTARATIDLLKDTFGDRLISRFGPVNWPPRSCDLTPLDYFLWGYVKSLVYADKPQTLDHLKDNIRRVIADIRPQMLEKVIENWTSRLDYIRASCGSPMPEIIFKMFRSLPTSLWPPPAKNSAPCACSEPWVHFKENFTKQKRGCLSKFGCVSFLFRTSSPKYPGAGLFALSSIIYLIGPEAGAVFHHLKFMPLQGGWTWLKPGSGGISASLFESSSATLVETVSLKFGCVPFLFRHLIPQNPGAGLFALSSIISLIGPEAGAVLHHLKIYAFTELFNTGTFLTHPTKRNFTTSGQGGLV
ncbi:uncharacterized protein TNCV_4869831 [Trichonephila clavipes]|nr:uncharacterized protein TNCV_4869831 [Trichonephila clavipes]